MPNVRVRLSNDFFKRAERVAASRIRKADLEKAVRPIINDVKRGINPKTGRRYKRLARSTVERRRRLSQFNPTGDRFSAGRANVTLTGALLNSIRQTFRKFKSSARLTLSFSGTHPGYKQVRGGRSRRVKNSIIADALAGIGYPILVLSKKNTQRIRVNLARIINRRLR